VRQGVQADADYFVWRPAVEYGQLCQLVEKTFDRGPLIGGGQPAVRAKRSSIAWAAAVSKYSPMAVASSRQHVRLRDTNVEAHERFQTQGM
jgi:hypothetical protein